MIKNLITLLIFIIALGASETQAQEKGLQQIPEGMDYYPYYNHFNGEWHDTDEEELYNAEDDWFYDYYAIPEDLFSSPEYELEYDWIEDEYEWEEDDLLFDDPMPGVKEREEKL